MAAMKPTAAAMTPAVAAMAVKAVKAAGDPLGLVGVGGAQLEGLVGDKTFVLELLQAGLAGIEEGLKEG